MPGGPADKLGNEYESWWTAFRVADILEGRATHIICEKLGPEGKGAEFEVRTPENVCLDQVKDTPGSGRWTIARLKQGGILSDAHKHLQRGAHFTFVSSTDCYELETITERARFSSSARVLLERLPSPLQADFRQIARHWSVDAELAHELLTRLFVEVHPRKSLWRTVEAIYQRLFTDEPQLVVSAIRSIIDSNLHIQLSSQAIWDKLLRLGCTRRYLVGDLSVIKKLSDSADRQVQRMDYVAPKLARVHRPEVATLVDLLQAGDAQIFICHGRAGSGKSQVVTDAITTLRERGWPTAVLRMDVVDGTTTTAHELGRKAAMSDSPAILLEGVANGEAGLLVIDQLDAVSLYSGRSPEAFGAVFEIVEQLRGARNVRLVLVVRTVDLRRDPRLNKLSSQQRSHEVEIGALAEASVSEALERSGYPVSSLDENVFRLLCVPLHYSVFSRLSPAAKNVSYSSLQQLYSTYTSEVRKTLERNLGATDWNTITTAVVEDLSENERLTAPYHVLDFASSTQIAALDSAHVLLDNELGYQFFHETYFDFLFARAFVAAGKDLVVFLLASGQHLFRRAQTLQVLDYLSAVDRPAMRYTVRRLLTHTEIRPHLIEVVVGALRSLKNPSHEDFLLIEEFAFSTRSWSFKLIGLLREPEWFDAADRAGRWERWLSTEELTDKIYRELMLASRERPSRVHDLLTPYVQGSGNWPVRFKALISWSLNSGLIDLAIELMENGQLDGARGPIAANSDFWSILHIVSDSDPVSCIRLMNAFLRRALALSGDVDDPFKTSLSDSSQSATSIISQLAENAPVDFVRHVTPFFLNVVERTAKDNGLGFPRGRWAFRYVDSNFSVSDSLFSALDSALRSHDVLEDVADEVLRDFALVLADETQFLTARILEKHPSADRAILWLLTDDRNLELGWMDNRLWASRSVIATQTIACSDSVLQELEQRLLTYYPAPERLFDFRRFRGHSQYQLLSAVSSSRLSDAGRRRVQELERKFGDVESLRPQPMMAKFVGPPVSPSAPTYMTDDDWRRAFSRHTSDETAWRDGEPVGGARQLATLFAQQVESDPDRYAQLALTLVPISAPALAGTIRAAAGKVSPSLMHALVRSALSSNDVEALRAACAAIQSHAQAGEIAVEMVDALKALVRSDDPDSELARLEAPTGPYYGGDLAMAGLNSVRGGAALAVASAVFYDAEQWPNLKNEIAALALDPILAVRACAAEAVTASLNANKLWALALAEKLLSPGLELLTSPHVVRLLIYSLILGPDDSAFERYLHQALLDDKVQAQAGRIWATMYLREELPGRIDANPSKLPLLARRAAAEAFARAMPEGVEITARLLGDPAVEVRRASSLVFYEVEHLSADELEQLLEAFVDSDFDVEEAGRIAYTLKDLPISLPNAALTLCEKTTRRGSGLLGDIATGAAVYSDSIAELVLRFYRTGGVEQRHRCLDVIDALTELGALGLERALSDVR